MNIGRSQILVGVAVIAVAILIIVPIVVSSSKSSRLEELEKNVNAIRIAEIQYHEAFGEYVSADAAPRPPHAVDANLVPWSPTNGFRKLSWAPESEQVIGSYQVQAEKDNFKVIGTCDVDGDGERATFEASKDQEAHAITGAGVY
jgi:type II secretory pathway pseudopilin PulG